MVSNQNGWDVHNCDTRESEFCNSKDDECLYLVSSYDFQEVRRRLIGRRVGATMTLVVVVGLATGAWLHFRRSSGDYRAVPWSLVGVAESGKAVLISIGGSYDSCVGPIRARVLRDNNVNLTLTVQLKNPDCHGLNDELLPVVTVPLRRPLHGALVNGAGMMDPPDSRRNRWIVPRIIGLAPRQAAAVLNAVGVQPTHVLGPSASGYWVYRQSPAPGHRLPGPLSKDAGPSATLVTTRELGTA
jgi:hypothetical protein